MALALQPLELADGVSLTYSQYCVEGYRGKEAQLSKELLCRVKECNRILQKYSSMSSTDIQAGPSSSATQVRDSWLNLICLAYHLLESHEFLVQTWYDRLDLNNVGKFEVKN